MTKTQKFLTSIFSIILCALFVLSIVDTHELVQKTNFNTDLMMTHVEKLSENGPHSIVDHETNQAAVDYVASVLQEYGIVNEDTTEKHLPTIFSSVSSMVKNTVFAVPKHLKQNFRASIML